MSMIDELLEYSELDSGSYKPPRRKKTRQWMGFDELGDFEAIKPHKQSRFDSDEDIEKRHSKRDLHRERRREKMAALERDF